MSPASSRTTPASTAFAAATPVTTGPSPAASSTRATTPRRRPRPPAQGRRQRPGARAPASMTVHRIRGPRDLQAHLGSGGGGSSARSGGGEGSSSNGSSNNGGAAALVVLSFVTPGCRACKYAQAAFARLAREFVPAGSRAVRFCEMDVSEEATQPLGRSLGVDAVPAFQLYALKDGGRGRAPAFGVLDELAGARVVGEIRKRLALYSSDGFDLDEYVFEE